MTVKLSVVDAQPQIEIITTLRITRFHSALLLRHYQNRAGPIVWLCEMMPASSSCLISWSTNAWYFCITVYGLDAIGGPSVVMSSLIKLVLPISTAFCEIISKYFLFRSSQSLVLASLGMSTSGMELANLLVSSSSCKLVFCNIWGSSLEVSHQSMLPPDLLNLLALSHRMHRCNWYVFANTTQNIISI